MSIHWFPGHMTKAKREIEARLSMVDCIIELRDSRLPLSSRNPLIDELGKDKPRLIVLTKKDMSDPLKTTEWVKKLQEDNTVVIALNLLKDDTRKLIVDGVLKVMEPKFARWKSKGIQPRAVKAMVLGIPNVGKSTLINQLAKKKLMTVANKPGVTMALKWANVHPKLDILDTPGLLWGRFEDHEVAVKLALSGSIAEKVLPTDELCEAAFTFILKNYPNALKQRYGYDGSELNEFLTVIAKSRGYIQNGDYKLNESIVTFLREFRQGDLGPMSLE